MELREYASLVRRRWVLIVIVLLAAVSAASAYTLATPATYEAHSEAFVSTQSASTATDLSQGSTFTQQVVKSYADVATTPYVLDSVISELKLSDTPAELAERVSATAPLDTVVIEITTSDRSPRLAAAIANSITRHLAAAVLDLAPDTQTGAAVKITQIQSASVPTVRSSPSWTANLTIGGALGFVLAIGIALVIERTDTRIRNVRDVEALTDRPVVGSIGYDPDAPTNPLVVARAGDSSRAEAYRTLRTNLRFLEIDSSHRSLVMTSSVAGEGKSTTAGNLALALAAAGEKVLLVDADLRRPQVATYFGIDGSVGLTDVLIGSVDLADALQVWGKDGLSVLPAGQIPPNPNELLQSQALSSLLNRIRPEFDTVIFDAPPLLPVSDAALLARQTDGAVLIASAARATRSQFTGALQNLDTVRAHVLGIVVTMLPARGPDSYGYRYGYGEYSTERTRGERRQTETQSPHPSV